jgi:hypothetical protein
VSDEQWRRPTAVQRGAAAKQVSVEVEDKVSVKVERR